MKIVYAGGGDTGAFILRRLAAEVCVAAVVAPPPRPRGRGMRLTPSPAAAAAADLRLPLSYAADAMEMAKHKADFIVVCDYGRLLPAEVLAAAPALNAHMSLLPRWRGAAPVERAILAGDAKTGVTIMRMDAGLDTGDILAQEEVLITPETSGGALREDLARRGADLLLRVLRAPADFAPTKQDERAATYAHKITAADRALNFGESAAACRRRVMAFAPRPGAHCVLFGQRITVRAASAAAPPPAAPPDAAPGALLAADAARGLLIACAAGALRIDELQPAGGKPMSAAAYLRGRRKAGQNTAA